MIHVSMGSPMDPIGLYLSMPDHRLASPNGELANKSLQVVTVLVFCLIK